MTSVACDGTRWPITDCTSEGLKGVLSLHKVSAAPSERDSTDTVTVTVTVTVTGSRIDSFVRAHRAGAAAGCLRGDPVVPEQRRRLGHLREQPRLPLVRDAQPVRGVRRHHDRLQLR